MHINFDLPETVAVFPLPGALLLPRAKLPLHIFEPRYLQMVEDCLKTDHRVIAMVQPYQTDADPNGLHKIGCAGRINQFTQTDDGRYMITLSGLSRFRILSEEKGFQPYRRCVVDFTGFERDLGKPESDVSFDRDAFLGNLAKYFHERQLETDWDSLKDAEDELLINSLAMLCPFDPEDRQALLEAPSLSTRRETLAALIEFSLLGGMAEDILQ